MGGVLLIPTGLAASEGITSSGYRRRPPGVGCAMPVALAMAAAAVMRLTRGYQGCAHSTCRPRGDGSCAVQVLPVVVEQPQNAIGGRATLIRSCWRGGILGCKAVQENRTPLLHQDIRQERHLHRPDARPPVRLRRLRCSQNRA